jgi:pyridoxal phosphate enzyme (YggS family)
MSVSVNILGIRERIRAAEIRAGRKEDSVSLMAVSKFHSAGEVIEAYRAGIEIFGENRVQEAMDKFPSVFESCPGAKLHLIGSLQRNKVKQIVPLVSCIESVDRPELLAEIAKQSSAAGKVTDILFEMHTGEESKAGYADDGSLFRSLDLLRDLPSVRCAGLMTMAPFTDDRDAIRASFRRLARLRQDCAKRYPSLDFSMLSMGMSGDFEIAIEEGSTLVRIGTAIFGERA